MILPKLAPNVIARPRVESWLDRNRNVPLRFVHGPAGCGKTTAIAGYLRRSHVAGAYVVLRTGESAQDVRTRIARGLGMEREPTNLADLADALAACAEGTTLVIDEFERADRDVRSELQALVTEAPHHIALIYAGQSRDGLGVGHLLARGVAAILDAETLAFDADEIAALAEALHVSHSTSDVARLSQETEGWAVAVSSVMREAAERGLGLTGAYDRWRKRHGRHFKEFVMSDVGRHGNAERETFSRVMQQGSNPTTNELIELEEHGMFVRVVGGACRPYRVVEQLFIGDSENLVAPQVEGLLLNVRLFGRFDATIGGRSIQWIRRRDAQIFKFLLLKRDGTASRNELLEMFWPQADHHLATQSLRTACSNIRKAIAALVGYEGADRYFTSQRDIGINLQHCVVDVRRFLTHAHDGDAEYDAERFAEARVHYEAAVMLYGGELLSGDYPEVWTINRTESLRVRYNEILERLAVRCEIDGDLIASREYADRLLRNDPNNDAVRQLRARVIQTAEFPLTISVPRRGPVKSGR